jgi:hypothetical protein
MARPRLTDWIAAPGPDAPSKDAAGYRELGLLQQVFQSKAPGQWSQNVFELSRHFKSAAFLAINTLATHASDSTFELVERTDDPEMPNGEVQLPWHDPAVQLFENPNPIDTFADIMYQSLQQRSITGMDLLWAPPAGNDVGELYVIPTANCWPLPMSYEYPQGAYRVMPYPYGLTSAPMGQIAAGAIIPAEQIIRTKNHHPYLRHDGYAVMTAVSQQIDTLEAVDTSRHNTMQQGCEQTLALESTSPMAMDPGEADLVRLRKQLELIYAGPKNAGKIWIPPTGWKLSQVSTVPKDMAWQEGWSQVLDFILASYGVPKAVAGLQDSVSYATLYSSLRAFCLFSLGPKVRQSSRSWDKSLVKPTWGPSITLKIHAPEFKDESLEEQRLSNDLKCGALKVKEWRKMRGYDHLDEPWTEERAVASYSPMSSNGEAGPGAPKQAESNGPREEDPNVNNARPATKGMRLEALANAFEKAKTNGHAHPIRN